MNSAYETTFSDLPSLEEFIKIFITHFQKDWKRSSNNLHEWMNTYYGFWFFPVPDTHNSLREKGLKACFHGKKKAALRSFSSRNLLL